MNIIYRCMAMTALVATPATATLAQNLNPGNSGGGHGPIATPTYAADAGSDPALTTGSRFSVTPNTPAAENPTVPGATGIGIVKGDNSTISGNRRATIEQKTGGAGSDTPG
nr:hypothetical protein [uncultured Rhodopila sp.]